MALLLRQVGRQLAPLPAQVGGNSSSLQQLQARFDMVEPRADKSNAQLQEAQAGLRPELAPSRHSLHPSSHPHPHP